MTRLAGRIDGVIGVDTHCDSLAVAAVDPVGGVLAHESAWMARVAATGLACCGWRAPSPGRWAALAQT